MVKIAFGMIVFEGNYVLKECLDCIYPHASQILIAEGPVKYWQEQGKTTSKDGTNETLARYHDPENKISIVHGRYSEKDEQCNAYMQFLHDDIDYVWEVDSDETYKHEDIEKVKKLLHDNQYTSMDVRSCSFYGGFDHYIGGFELSTGNFHRIFKVYPGSRWVTHRPPTMGHAIADTLPNKHLDSDRLYGEHGVQMYHYSYVFPNQVYKKIAYYKAKVSMSNCIDDYFNRVYLPWITGDDDKKAAIEEQFNGVHEFKPESRIHAKTLKFNGAHPQPIADNIHALSSEITQQLKNYV